MTYSPNVRLGPEYTPRSLKYLLLITAVVSLFAAITDKLFPSLFGWTSPMTFLSFSAIGIKKFYLWQFLSYLFIYPAPEGFNFSFLLSLGFNLYILWIIGANLIEKKGSRAFFSLYFLTGVLCSLSLFCLQILTSNLHGFAGNLPSLYALLISWVVLFPDANLLLFFAFPFKAKWIIYGVLVFNTLVDLSVGDWMRALVGIEGACIGFLYAKYFWAKQGAFTQTKRFDFKTGNPIYSDDDDFLEAMLSKISLKGKQSLTWTERWRLKRISKKRKK